MNMKTQVTQTSIEAYHTVASKNSGNTRLEVAMFILSETKQGRPTCLADIHYHFRNHPSLREKSTVSARLNEIKNGGIVIDGQEYRIEFVSSRPSLSTGVKAQHFCMVLAKGEPKQLQMF